MAIDVQKLFPKAQVCSKGSISLDIFSPQFLNSRRPIFMKITENTHSFDSLRVTTSVFHDF